MRLRIWLVLTMFFTLVTGSACAQDLAQLQARVTKFWEARSRLNRAEAMKFIDLETQNVYLQLTESPLTSFKILGIEFSENSNQVYVSVSVHGVTAGLAEMDRTVRDTWIWKDGQWLMHATATGSMFDSAEKKPVAPVQVDFQVTQKVIDAGRRAQGEVVEGTIPFHGSRVEIRTIRPVQSITGLTFGAPVWQSASEGYLSYRWETTLLSENVDQTVTLEALTTSELRGSVDLHVRARIDGRMRFKQVPELVDPAKAPGQIELQIQNVSNKQLKILSVMSSNPAYVVDDNVPELIEPGKTGSLLIRYTKPGVSGASIGFVFSENLAGLPITTVPLRTVVPEEKRASSYTFDDLKQFAPQTLPPAPK